MKLKTMKILVVIATVSLMIACFAPVALGAADPANLIGAMEGQDMSNNTTTLTALGGKLLSVLQITGVIVGTVILAVLGLKYMAGSLEEKAEYKKTMIPYLVGAVIIFAAPMLAKGIFTLIGNLNT